MSRILSALLIQPLPPLRWRTPVMTYEDYRTAEIVYTEEINGVRYEQRMDLYRYYEDA